MKWFMACNELHFDEYWPSIQVAIASCWQAKHDLQPHFIFDGPDRPELEWLKARGVIVHRHRVTFEQAIRNFYGENRAETAMGCFLRTEIPLLCDDEYAFYTDCDVMFTGVPLRDIWVKRPPLFCAAPQFDKTNWTMFNAGVLLINVPWLRSALPSLPSFFQHADCYDQPTLLALSGGRWSRLKPEYNWKSYWPVNKKAKIIHFHGPKPEKDYSLWPHDTREIVASLRRGGFRYHEEQWKRIRDAVEEGTYAR